jgi:putative PIN family toxin of toxin-antitoxin system
MLDELNDVIYRPKFSNRLTLLNKTPTSVIADYLQFAEIIEVEIVYPLVAADSDDDHVLACAFSAQADCIVSGDPHLLSLETIRGIVILSVSKFLQWIESEAT